MKIAQRWMYAGLAMSLCGCRQGMEKPMPEVMVQASKDAMQKTANVGGEDFVGFDRNGYPGDARLADLRKSFAFVGFWLNNPPGETNDDWAGKRDAVRGAGLGFLILWNGRLDKQILKAQKVGTAPDTLGKNDAAAAIAAARREGFPKGAIVFLDQEEGGRLLDEQAAYFFGWTEAVAASEFRPGAYLSGQSTPDGTGPDGKASMITTAQDVREQVVKRRLHPVYMWVAQDTCPPAPGCVLRGVKLVNNGTALQDFGGDVLAWQYAQSPQRPALTRSCAKTYAADGMCYAGVSKDLFLDLDVAATADPSGGR